MKRRPESASVQTTYVTSVLGRTTTLLSIHFAALWGKMVRKLKHHEQKCVISNIFPLER